MNTHPKTRTLPWVAAQLTRFSGDLRSMADYSLRNVGVPGGAQRILRERRRVTIR